MAAVETVIDFSRFVEILRQEENNGRATTLSEQIESLLASTESNLETLVIEQSPRGEKEFLVFDALVARKEIRRLCLNSTLDASCIPPLVSRIEKGALELVALGGMPISGSQATDIFKTLLPLGLAIFGIVLKEDYCPGVIRAFQHFLRENSSPFLALRTQLNDWISIETFQDICTGILHSSLLSVKFIGLKVRGDNNERVHEILAEMILDSSSSIKGIHVDTSDPGDISPQSLSCALRRHPVIQNLAISFRTKGQDALLFDRNPWWKRLLAVDDLPLSLWSLLLEKANTWKHDTSHSNLDVVYFLLQEKNTELLQNVRRRRIRKRKRYGFS